VLTKSYTTDKAPIYTKWEKSNQYKQMIYFKEIPFRFVTY